MREIANILKISKSAKLLVKMKKMTFILWKKTQTDFLANPIGSIESHTLDEVPKRMSIGRKGIKGVKS